MKTAATTLTLALTLFAAAPAYAGGVNLQVKTAKEYTQDAKGVVTMKVEIEHAEFDCVPTVFLVADAKAGTPTMKLERYDAKTKRWTEVSSWLELNPGYGGQSWSTPYRLGWGQALTVKRKAKLEPGTYRVSVRFKALDLGYEDWRTSDEFVVLAP